MSAAPKDAPSRAGRRREHTHAALLAAAHAVFSERGIDATRISDITGRADVGFGSFYNHFADKEAIVAEVLQETAQAHTAEVEALTRDIAAPAEVVALAHQHFVRLAFDDKAFGWLLVRTDATHHLLSV